MVYLKQLEYYNAHFSMFLVPQKGNLFLCVQHDWEVLKKIQKLKQLKTLNL